MKGRYAKITVAKDAQTGEFYVRDYRVAEFEYKNVGELNVLEAVFDQDNMGQYFSLTGWDTGDRIDIVLVYTGRLIIAACLPRGWYLLRENKLIPEDAGPEDIAVFARGAWEWLRNQELFYEAKRRLLSGDLFVPPYPPGAYP